MSMFEPNDGIPMFDLGLHTALVTGAGQGMGLGIAKALARQGCDIILNDLYESRTLAAAEEVSKHNTTVYPLHGDITKPEFLENLKAMITHEPDEHNIDIDILVNNAGVPEGMPTSLAHADKLAEEDYNKQMELNHFAVRKLCQFVLPDMRSRGYGRILIITSESHRMGLSMGLSHYAAAKSATLGYMRALAAEVGHDGVTINALSLGSMNNFDGHERAAISTLVGRAGTPEDVGAAALYLCSDEASWMTGQTIPLNGGACTA